MKKVMKIIYFYILSFLFYNNVFCRIFFTPSIDNWKQYSSIWDYPSSVSKIDRDCSYLFDIGASFVNRNSFQAWVDRDGTQIKGDLASMFHGKSEFFLDEVRTITSSIISDYLIQPSYTFNEKSCSIAMQVSKDFSSCDYELRSTLRCTIPFISNYVLNNNSAFMYYSSNQSNTKHVNNKFKKSQGQQNRFSTVSNPSSELVKLGRKGNANVFTVRGDYIPLSYQDPTTYAAILQDNTNIQNTYLAFNKYLPPYVGSPLTIGNAPLTINQMRSAYVLVGDDDNPSHFNYRQVVNKVDSTNIEYIIADPNTTYPAQISTEDPATATNVNGLAWLSLLQYNIAWPTVFSAKNDGSVQYPVSALPLSISDLQNGDFINFKDLYTLNITGSSVNDAIIKNSYQKIVASGQYNNTPYNKNGVEFTLPPVLFQKTGDTFGEYVPLPIHSYSSTPGVQFDQYNPNSSGSNLITILNEDGTFFDPSCQYATLWFSNNYEDLFKTNTYISNLENIWMTSSLTEDSYATKASQIIYDNLSDGYDCCDSLQTEVDLLNSEIVNLAIAVGMNQTLTGTPQDSNSSIRATAESLARSEVLNKNKNDNQAEHFNNIVNVRTSLSNELRASSVPEMYFNGISKPIQYNEFQQNGLGDILLEFMLGGYMDNNRLLLEGMLAAQLPSSTNLNTNDSYFGVPIGTNGHYALRIGANMAYDLDTILKVRFQGKCYIEHAIKGFEQLIPEIEGKSIISFVPVKMDTNVSWNSGLVILEAALYATDFTNVSFGYQYWKKSQDCIKMLNPMDVSFIAPIAEIEAVSFDNTMAISNRSSQTLFASFCSRLTDDFVITFGLSNVITGTNTGALLDYFATIDVSF